MRRIVGILLICFIIVSVFSGCGVLKKLGIIKGDSEELTPASSIVMGEGDAVKLSDKVPIHIYFANSDFTKLRKEIRYIPVSEAKKSASNIATLIVKELIKGPDPKSDLKATIPAGTQLRAPVKIETGVATVDFTQEFKSKQTNSGKSFEQAAIYSIVNSLTELKEIQKVRFLIGGKSYKEYLGNFQFDAPFPRTPSLISKDNPINMSVPTGNLIEPVSTTTKDTNTKESTAKKENTTTKEGTATQDKVKDTSGEDISGDAEETYIELWDEEEILE